MIAFSPYLIATCGAGSAFSIALSLIPSTSPLAKRLKKMERVSERSVSTRVTIIEQIVSKERTSQLQARLIEGGWYRVSVAQMTLRGIGSCLAGAIAGITFITLVAGNETLGIVTALFAALVGWRIPSIMLARAIAARKENIQRALPDFLDVMATTVGAGLSLNAALVQAVESTPGPLGEELRSTLAEIRLGRPRADALNSLAQRVNEDCTSTMVTAIVQAERLGSNLCDVLQELARETRDRRWIRAEEKASQLPIKMILPMALFMIPSLYLMIFGPVIARLVLGR